MNMHAMPASRAPVAGSTRALSKRQKAKKAVHEAPSASGSDVQLTPKGVAYCLRHGRPAIERRIERHLALVTALLAVIDVVDGDPDQEPNLGAPEGRLSVPHYWGGTFQAPLFDSASPIDSQMDWARGSTDDGEENVEDEGEAVNEDGGDVNDEPQGPSWTESNSLTGTLLGGAEDDEASVSLTEAINQSTRTIEAPGWPVHDGEADYFVELPFGRVRTFEADEEEQMAGPMIVRGKIIADREATECGMGVCDDHGIADNGGLAEQAGGTSAGWAI
jgi:hypothetical protein